MTKSSSQVTSPRRAFPSRQRRKRLPIPILLTTVWKVMEGKVRKREKRVMREERRERMTGMRVKLTGEPLKKEVQEALGMATFVHLFSPKCGLSMTLS